MSIETFLRLVMPDAGKKIIAQCVPTEQGRPWFKYTAHDTVSDAAKAALELDQNESTVYFAVNSFGNWYLDEAIGKKRIRTQENVVACRSLYDDFDVGAADRTDPAKHETKDEALRDIIKLGKALRLTPTIASSGGGCHCYFHADEDMDVATWKRLAALKRSITMHLGLKADRAVDMDVARILRPVGTHNRKTGSPVPVEIIKLGKAYPISTLEEAMQQYITDNNVTVAEPKSDLKTLNPFAAALEVNYPPSYTAVVAEHCAAVRQFKDSEGDVPEPHWHKVIGVLKHCVGGETAIHDWSKGYKDYSRDETQAKIDAWTVGPTLCEEMDRHVGCMANCPVADRCKSPIQLGSTGGAPHEEAPAQQNPQPVKLINGQHIPYWPKDGYHWSGSTLMRASTGKDGVVEWRNFCKSFVYLSNRIEEPDKTWTNVWKVQEKNGKWREFRMPTSELASTDMAKTFAAHEVFLSQNKTARGDMAEFAQGLIDTLQAWRQETKTYSQFGWVDDFQGFVLGTTKITAKGEEPVLCSDDMPPDVKVDFGTSGTLDEWIDNIDVLYNRKGAEPLQFALCHSMGSALVELMGSSNWHGLPLAFTGHGGTGKSTAAKIACGFYGNPEYMERQTGEQGSTLNAAIRRIAIMGSVPVLLDEFSGRSPDELTRTGYALANGRDKERLGPSGKFATTGGQWRKNSFITSNDSIHENISKLPAGYRVEATQLRFFEVQLAQDFRTEIFHDVSQSFVESHMDKMYGHACRPFLQFVIKNHGWVKRQLQAARAKLNPRSDDDNKERFYRDTIVTAWVAGKIAVKLGLVTFNVNDMKAWAIDQVVKMRDSRKEINIDIREQLARFIATLPGRLIITRGLNDGRSKQKEVPQEILRAPAVGRICTEDKKAYITVGCVRDYCKENDIPASDMREALDADGYLVTAHGGSVARKLYIGAGSTIPSGQTWCYELQYHKLFDGKAIAIVPDISQKHAGASSP